MKKILLSLVLGFSSMSLAQSGSGVNELNVNVGATSSAGNIGASWIRKTSDTAGWGAYAFSQAEENDADVFQTMALGALVQLNVYDQNNLEAYLAPGFGVAMVSDVPNDNGGSDDETMIGPSMRIGARYQLTSSLKLGAERLMFANWTEKNAPGFVEYTSLTLGFEF